jgi:pantoate--beta-alanine ligase
MVRDLDLPIEMAICPTIRETDGLAMSSRNVYLQGKDRQTALCLFQALELARLEVEERRERDLTKVQAAMRAHLESQPGVKVDYAVIADADTLEVLWEPRPKMVALIAARVGSTRLIDNRELSWA